MIPSLDNEATRARNALARASARVTRATKKRRPRDLNASSREVTPVGEWQMGPRTEVHFMSRPIALPDTTVRLRWGDVWLIVRVRERRDGISYGDVLETVPAHA